MKKSNSKKILGTVAIAAGAALIGRIIYDFKKIRELTKEEAEPEELPTVPEEAVAEPETEAAPAPEAAPAAEEVPAEETPVEEAPAEEAPVEEAPAEAAEEAKAE